MHAREFGVIIFCLPPHTTHGSQPQDASVFRSLKQNWQHACHNFIQSNPSLAITKNQFSGLFSKAWGKAMNPVTICSGFRRRGVYPLNPDVIDCSISIVNPEASLHEVDEDVGSQDNQGDDGMSNPQQCNNGQSSISHEKAALFQQRFQEGYDLPDDDYVKWLHETHPESITNQLLLRMVQAICSSVMIHSQVYHLKKQHFSSVDLKKGMICLMMSM